MTLRVVNQGEAALLDLATSIPYQVRLFTNDVTDGLSDSQINALDEDDFTEATFVGYAPVTLSTSGWSAASEGAPTSKPYGAAASFLRSSTGTAETIYGYYVTRSADGALVWFEEFASSVEIDTAGEQIDVTVVLTLADTVDS